MEVVKASEPPLVVILQCGYASGIAIFICWYDDFIVKFIPAGKVPGGHACIYIWKEDFRIYIKENIEQERLNLYHIDMKYIRNLHNIDDRVSSVSPQIGKQHRIYVGIVVICNRKKYLIPFSHPVEKHRKMKTKADFDKIYDKNSKLIGVLNYNLMIPVEEKQLIKVNLKSDKNDSAREKHYKQLCIDELNWCRKNADIIINKANCLYRLCMEEPNYKGKNRCLDFKRLETECDKYNAKIK